MKYLNAYNLIKNIKEDLDVAYETSGHPTPAEISYLKERNYNINSFSYYDGKTLYANTEQVIIGATKYMGDKTFEFIDKSIFPYEILILEHFTQDEHKHFNSDPLNGSDSYHIIKRNTEDMNEDDYIILDSSTITEDMREFINKLVLLFNHNKDPNHAKYVVRLVEI